MRERSHYTVWDCGRYAVRDDEGDCNLHEQFCLRGGQRTADYNPSATSLRTGATSPYTGEAFFVCGRDEGQSNVPRRAKPNKNRAVSEDTARFRFKMTYRSVSMQRRSVKLALMILTTA